jgi:hypothetical protein
MVRPTRFERVRRIEAILNWLGRGLSVPQIKIQARKEWNVCGMTAHRYLLRAREWQLRMIKSPVDFYRAGAMRFYDQLLMDPKITIKDKLQAMKQKMEVLTMMDRRFDVKHSGRVGIDASIGEGVSELIEAMSGNSRIRDEVLNLDRDIKAVEQSIASDKDGCNAIDTDSHGIDDPIKHIKIGSVGANGTNGTNGNGYHIVEIPNT